jgi:hypothetical protein
MKFRPSLEWLETREHPSVPDVDPLPPTPPPQTPPPQTPPPETPPTPPETPPAGGGNG